MISLFRALSILDYDKGKLKIYLAGSTGNQEEYEEHDEMASGIE